MEEIVLIVLFLGLLYLPQRLSIKYKLLLGIPYCMLILGYLWWEASYALHFKLLFTVLIGYGVFKQYRIYTASLTEKREGSI